MHSFRHLGDAVLSALGLNRFVLKTMKFVLKTTNFVIKTMNFVLKIDLDLMG